MFGAEKEERFKLRAYVETIGESCVIRNVKFDDKIIEVKQKVEAFIGIPSYLLQLFYLDECPLEDSKPLSYFHILPDAKIKVRVWKTNKNLVIAARNGTWKDVERELQLKDKTHYTISPPLTKTITHDLDRPLTALFVACFHGNDDVVENLLQRRIVNKRKPLQSGRECIQVAATRDHARCVELLLGRKLRPHEWHHERSLLMNWELQDRIKSTIERIKLTRRVSKTPHFTRLTESQKYDSSLSTWYKGDTGQIYLCVILAPVSTADVGGRNKSGRTQQQPTKLKVFKP